MKKGPGYQLWSLAGTMRMSSAAVAAPAVAAAPAAPAPPPPPANPNMMEVFVNDQPITVPRNFSVLQACDAAGVDIPR